MGDVEFQMSPTGHEIDARSIERSQDEISKTISSKVESICTEERLNKLWTADRQTKKNDPMEYTDDEEPDETNPVIDALYNLPETVRDVSAASNRASFGFEHAI